MIRNSAINIQWSATGSHWYVRTLWLRTRVKFALICSWDSDCLMLRHSCAVVASDSSSWQPGSLRVRLMPVRTRLRLKPSFPAPSWRTSSPMLAFSKASLVSLMAELKTPQMSTHEGIFLVKHYDSNNPINYTTNITLKSTSTLLNCKLWIHNLRIQKGLSNICVNLFVLSPGKLCESVGRRQETQGI